MQCTTNLQLTGNATRSKISSEQAEINVSATSKVPPEVSTSSFSSTDARVTTAPARRITSTVITASISSVPNPIGTRTYNKTPKFFKIQEVYILDHNIKKLQPFFVFKEGPYEDDISTYNNSQFRKIKNYKIL